MMKRSFFSAATPRLRIASMPGLPPHIIRIETPRRIMLLIEDHTENEQERLVRKGDVVQRGQKLSLTADSDAYAVSPVSGTIADIEPFAGESGKRFTALKIDVSKEISIDEGFAAYCDAPSLEGALGLMRCLPGSPAFDVFTHADKPIRTIVINAMDQDLFVITAQYALKVYLHELAQGIRHLKAVTGVQQVVIAAPRGVIQGYGDLGASVIAIEKGYPAGLPHLIAQRLTGHEIPVGKKFQDLGLAFFNVEAIVSLGRSVRNRKIARTKLVTFLDKNGKRSMLSVTIGTPIGDILTHFGLTMNHQDRIIIGGPLNGFSIYSESFPIRPDTDAVLLQDKEDVTLVSDYPCINCGDCIRVCPARVQVSMLIRLIEAGEYGEAAERYDLWSCLECGLCSYVCVSKIPIYQSIKLAKYELARAAMAEAADE